MSLLLGKEPDVGLMERMLSAGPGQMLGRDLRRLLGTHLLFSAPQLVFFAHDKDAPTSKRLNGIASKNSCAMNIVYSSASRQSK